jgi:hypothetical protein
MLIQRCFIRKNTKELREKLEKLGYKLNHGKAWGKYLICFRTEDTDEDVFVGSPEWDLENMPKFENAINCGTNEDLFLAIAALQNDTDSYQWFVFDHDEIMTAETAVKKGAWLMNQLRKCPYKYAHKATVDELIEHFKK